MIAPIALCAAAFGGDVVVWHAYKGAEEAGLQEAARTFEQRAGHRITLVAVPFGVFESKVETAVPRGNGPDLIVFAHASAGKWSAMDVISPVSVPLEGQLPTAVAALTIDERVWGVPLAVKAPVLLYDPSRISVPPATTDELLELARLHTGDGAYGLAYEAAAPYYHAAWMHGFGASTYGDDGVPHLADPEHIQALAFAARLSEEHLLPIRPSAERVSQLYEEGKATFVISGPWFVADLERPIAAARLPVVSESGRPARPYLTVDAAYLSAQSAEPEPALAFAIWLAGPEGATIRATTGKQAVSSRDVAIADPIVRVVADQAADAVPLPTDPDVQAVFEAQALALRRVMRGAATPEAAAREAQAWYENLARPRPKPVSLLPYVVFGLLGVAGVASLGAREIARPGVVESVRRHRWDYLWVLPSAITVAAVVVAPFVIGATVSLFEHYRGEWTFVGLRNFADILLSRGWPLTSPMSFFYTLVVTVLWTAANLVAHVAVGVALALVLREPWVRLRAVWRGALILPWAIPNYITALIWRTMFDAQYGAVNTLLGAISGRGEPAPIDWFGSFSTAFCANLATNTWLGFPFMMVVTLGALQSVPRELEEAAEVDGAGYWVRFRHVVWPLLKPALLPAIVLGSVWTFNMFNVICLVSAGEPDGSTEILISQAYKWAFTRGNMYGYAAAYAVIIFAVLLVYSRGTRRLLTRSTG